MTALGRKHDVRLEKLRGLVAEAKALDPEAFEAKDAKQRKASKRGGHSGRRPSGAPSLTDKIADSLIGKSRSFGKSAPAPAGGRFALSAAPADAPPSPPSPPASPPGESPGVPVRRLSIDQKALSATNLTTAEDYAGSPPGARVSRGSRAGGGDSGAGTLPSKELSAVGEDLKEDRPSVSSLEA